VLDTIFGEPFFARHCYMTGSDDPFAQLKPALKADIGEDACATIYSTMSPLSRNPTPARSASRSSTTMATT